MKNRSLCPTNRSLEVVCSSASVNQSRVALIALAGLAGLGLACSGGSSGSGTGGSSGSGSGGTSGGGAAPYKPCAEDQQVGAFTLELKAAEAGNAAYSQVGGGIRDSVRPSDVWVTENVSGSGSECKLVVGPTNNCSPACTTEQVCKGTTCQPAPVSKSVGDVSFTGLVVPVKMTPTMTGSSIVYFGSIPTETAYPPYTVGADLGLTAVGADYPGFSLTGKGIEPLATPTQSLDVAKDKALTIKWNAPSAAGKGKIQLIMDIAHHGGVAAEIHCDLDDSGTYTIPAPLMTALLAKGAFGFPTVTLTRASVDSKMVGPGCMEFNVAAGVSLPLNIAGVVSCTMDSECMAPAKCLMPGYKCG